MEGPETPPLGADHDAPSPNAAAPPSAFVGGRLGFTAGVGAAVVFLATVVFLRLVSGVISLPEIVADGLLLILPGALFSAVLDTLRTAAKPLLFAGIAIGTLVVGGALGSWYGREPGLRRGVTVAVTTWLLFGALVYPLVGAGLFGSRLSAGLEWHGPSLLALCAIFAVALSELFHRLATRAGMRLDSTRPERRVLVRALGLGALGLLAGGSAWRLWRPSAGVTDASQATASVPVASGAASGLVVRPGEVQPGWDVAGLSPEVIPTADFYQVSKNFINPVVQAGSWKLRIDGMVDRPLEFSYDELRALPASEGYYTLMCISNEVGGEYWGNAYWRGVKLKALLDAAGMQRGVVRAQLTAADDYRDSLPIDRAVHPDALLAWEMNGEPLTKDHGFPARLLIPGIYGMENVKWLTGITLVPDEPKGYWQQRGWADSPAYRTASRIDAPKARATLSGGSVDVAGVAFAGDRGLQRVEVSADDGATWVQADVKAPLSPYTWQLWRARLAVDPSVHTLRVRAVDGLGRVQSGASEDPFPDGSSGYHTITVSANV